MNPSVHMYLSIGVRVVGHISINQYDRLTLHADKKLI